MEIHPPSAASSGTGTLPRPPAPGEGGSTARQERSAATEAHIGPGSMPPAVEEAAGETAAKQEQETVQSSAPDGDEPAKSQEQGSAVSWSDKVRANSSQSPALTEVMTRKAHMLEGVWNPAQAKQLIATLMFDWNADEAKAFTTDQVNMRTIAPANARCDANIRPWTEGENVILMDYLNGVLELPHPPNFIKEIFVSTHRAMMEDMHEARFNSPLTATVPASVRLSKNAPHAQIYRELFLANTDKNTGHDMLRALQRDVKRLSFDGNQTITFVFTSARVAAKWEKKTLRFQRAVIVLQDTAQKYGEQETGTFNPAQLDLQYAVRVYGGDAKGLLALHRAFSQFSGATVLDVEYARATSTDIYDNRYYTIRFAQRECPKELLGVTRIILGSIILSVHHFQRYLRRPCTHCYDQRHGAAKCTTPRKKLDASRARATRHVPGGLAEVSPLQLQSHSVATVGELVGLLQQHLATVGEGQPLRLLQMDNADSSSVAAAHEHRSTVETTIDHVKDIIGLKDHPDTRVDADGFIIKEPRRAKQNVGSKGNGTHNTTPPDAEVEQEQKERGEGRSKSRGRGAKETGTVNGNGAKGKSKPRGNLRQGPAAAGANQTGKANKRYEQFQRKEAMGCFSALAESDADDEDSDAMEVDAGAAIDTDYRSDWTDEEAPYAYAADDYEIGPAAAAHSDVMQHESSRSTGTAAVAVEEAMPDIEMSAAAPAPIAQVVGQQIQKRQPHDATQQRAVTAATPNRGVGGKRVFTNLKRLHMEWDCLMEH